MPDGAPLPPTQKGLLRFLTCGSVDDGKSTLIGRLLHDSAAIHTDQLDALKRDSQRFGTTGGDLDLSLLLDGLEDERQQKITIDVAYRFFATPQRSFIVADTPGTSNTRATWRRAPRPPISPCCWSTRAKACSGRRGGMR